MIRKAITIEGKLITKYFKDIEDRNLWIKEISERYSDTPLPNEIWKKIPGFSRYEASNFGRLRSLNYKNSGIIKVLTPGLSTDGYLKTVLLNDKSKYITVAVHRVIALVFKGKKPKNKEVNHKDGIKINNFENNLEYLTRQQNVQHSIKLGLQIPFRGSEVGTSKLTEDKVKELRELKKRKGRFWGRNEIAKELGVSPKHLQKIVNKPELIWKHV